MKRILTFILLLIWAQLSAQTHEECGTEQRHQRLMQTDPAYRASFESHQKQMREALNSPHARTQAGVYKIPVVVHILHVGSAVGTAENISDEQVYSAIEYMNKAYAHQAPYNQGTQGVNVGIEFCLVQKDPSGNPTTGIDRVNMSSNSTYVASGITDATELTIKNSTSWNRTKYYNIWIVSEIDDNGAGSGVQGYAYFPGAGSYDGAVILYNSFGYDPAGTSGFNLKSYTNMNITATHEIGHALNLYHSFEGDGTGSTCPTNTTCSVDGDEVCDTPPHMRSTSNCVTGTNTCTGGSKDLYIHNFMDYSSDDCQYEFTAGQSSRMIAALTSASSRTSLVSAANLTSCGCDGDLPIIRFVADNTNPCPGQTVTFTDHTLNFPTSWNWSFPGGTPSTSTAQNPTVTYSAGGPYNVTLTVNSGQTGRTLTKTAFINPQNGQALPFTENFTSGTFAPTGWTITNPDGGETWERASTDGSTNFAARMDNYNYETGTGQVDQLISPYLDLTGYTGASLTFRVANKTYATDYDTLKVIITTNCDGTGGTVVYNKYGATLSTFTGGTGGFVPASGSEWRTEPINLNAYVGQRIRIVFRNISRYGNNTYIDDINLTGSGAIAPTANFTANLTTVTTGQTVTFTSTSTGAVTGYNWNFGSGATPATANTVGPHAVTYSTTGTKTVTLAVSGPAGNDTEAKTSYITVTTPTGALASSDDASLTVYPNPANTVLYLEADADKYDKVEIFSMKGEMMMELSVDTGNGMLDISTLAPGVYVARFSGNEYYGTRRFTVIR